MTRGYWSIVCVLLGVFAVALANAVGLWWLSYLIGAVLAIWIRPSLAGLAVLLGWGAGFMQSAIGDNLSGSARVVALLAGLPASLGPVLVAIALILAFLEGWLPAILARRVLTIARRPKAAN